MAKESTTASTVQQIPPPGSHVSAENAGYLGVTVASIIGAILWLRRRTSRDGLEVLKDRTEGVMLKNAQEDRDRAMSEAREAWSHRALDARAIGELTAENAYLKREVISANEQLAEIRLRVQGLGQQVDATKNSLNKAEKKIGESGITPLGKE